MKQPEVQPGRPVHPLATGSAAIAARLRGEGSSIDARVIAAKLRGEGDSIDARVIAARLRGADTR